jgi:hypothetical protein
MSHVSVWATKIFKIVGKESNKIMLLLGCVKGKKYSRYHLTSLAAEMNSGLQVWNLVRRFVKASRGQGLSFQDKFRALLLIQFVEGELKDRLKKLK